MEVRLLQIVYKSSEWSRILTILFVFCGMALAQSVKIVPAPGLQLPGVADSNSPSHWTNGKLVVFNSNGLAVRSEGSRIEDLGRVRAVQLYSYAHVPMWIEATYKAPDGKLYAWYHHEVFLGCEDNPVSAPKIGALRSDDDGLTFHDLGIVMQAAGEADCSTRNRYFGGGNGDFSAIVDADGAYVYFLYSNYSGELSSQGVAIARMRVESLDDPVGQVYKYSKGSWDEPGLGGEESPVFAATSSWASENADAFWGPSIHWNTHLSQYVMLMNRSCCGVDWEQEGIYASFSPDLSRPWTWTQPVKIFDGGGWYPMVMGLEEGGTDKLAGRQSRLFMGSDSNWLIEFELE